MSEQWMYTKDGQEAGPVPISQLRAMHEAGELSSSALVRPVDEANAAARTLEEILAFDSSAVSQSASAEGGTASSPSVRHAEDRANEPQRTRDWLRDRWDEFASGASLATHRSLLQARRFRLTSTTLPSAYLALGKSVREQGRFRDEFSELYQELDDLVDEIAELEPAESGTSRVEFPSLVDQLREWASKLAGLPQRELLASHARSLLRELGRKAYDAHGDDAGPDRLVADIRRARSKVEVVDAELGKLEESDIQAGHDMRDATRQTFKKLVDTGAALAAEVPRAWSRARAKAEANARREDEPSNPPKES